MVDPTQATPQGNAEPQSPGSPIEGAPATELFPERGAPTPQKAAARTVRSLAHAAGSFLLYDAANEAVASFIGDLRESLDYFLATYGDLDLEVRPWDITYRGQVVFLDRERERSLPFRLYRDGVRKLRIQPDVAWEEIVNLLGILAIRAKGIRQHEDDVVTMLWNASFKSIEVVAVEGLVAEDDERVADVVTEAAGAVTPRTALQAMIFNAPYMFDYPLPPLGERGAVVYRHIPPEMMERIRRQDSLEGLPLECAQLASELLDLLTDEFDPLSPDDVTPLLREIRSHLLQEGLFRPLGEILKIVDRKAPRDGEARAKLMAAVADSEVFRLLLAAAGDKQQLSVEELSEIVALLPGDHIPTILDHLATHPDGAGRQLGLRLVEHEARSRPQRICERLLANRDAADLELLRVLERVNPEKAVEVALELLGAKAAAVQVATLGMLSRVPYSARIGRAISGALRSPNEDVRRQALDALVAQKERRAYDTLVEQLKTRASGQVSPAEAAAVGEAMAHLEPDRARKQLAEWVRPPGLLGRLTTVPVPLRWAAVSGLVVLGGADAAELLTWLAGKTSGELQQHCEAALGRLGAAAGGRS